MKIRILIIVAVLVLFGLTVPARAENTQLLQPLKSYSLYVLPDASRQFVKIEPPAIKIIIYLRSGETAVRCGVSTQAYSCTPGNPLKISATPETPIQQFWAENFTEQQAQLKIDVLETSVTAAQGEASTA